ncbi:hypothetical protein VitviT2T_002536 [Vitis vinifera]|uniref:Uncharacterized protein n=1 Tax=Vitis vinifera TaxID=29760 RepID=A0ABY9BK94_VITVI|nr:hypothetical protein VitviT2T_002536 [Vitis vinifera]
MDEQQELQANLEAAKVAKTIAQKAAKEGTSLLRKAELENEALGMSKVKVKEKCIRLKLKLEQIKVGFAKKKKKLEVAYQQQVDDMFFYNYHCCMKKYGITDDIPSIPSDDEDEVVLGDGTVQGDDSTVGEGFTTVDNKVQDTP